MKSICLIKFVLQVFESQEHMAKVMNISKNKMKLNNRHLNCSIKMNEKKYKELKKGLK